MTRYNVEIGNRLARLKMEELAWRELYEEFFRTTKCKCGQPYNRILGGFKFTCPRHSHNCYPYRMFDLRSVPIRDLRDWIQRQQAMN